MGWGPGALGFGFSADLGEILPEVLPLLDLCSMTFGPLL